MSLVECIPNVSEGRSRGTIDACAAAIRTTPARLLDASSDASHNRSVFTLAGDRDAVAAAVMALFDCAVASIDLRHHSGGHPRIGAVDVVPFVPLDPRGGAAMADCVALAREVGEAVANRYNLPVFLYEEAASHPDRRRLEHIRRGGFEGLAAKLQDPRWRPDFGPARPHPSAGATVIGARRPLIAYNVDLRTQDLSTATAIAETIRESSGGLRCVKAMAVALPDRGTVQVSMNLTDFEVTSMLTVFNAVSREAAARGVVVARSEIVGLVPAAALPPDPERTLKLESPAEGFVLERRLA